MEQASARPRWTPEVGADVYGADGDKVGKLIEVTAQYVVVEKGFVFPTDYYVPVDAIATLDGDKVYLSVTKDEALGRGWDVPLTGDAEGISPVASGGHATEDFDASGTATYAAERNEWGAEANSAALGTTGYMGQSPTSPGLAGDLTADAAPRDTGTAEDSAAIRDDGDGTP